MKIELDGAIKTVEELLEGLQALNGAEPDEAPTRKAREQRARITRALLYLSHLGDRASVQVMGAYHDCKIGSKPFQDS